MAFTNFFKKVTDAITTIDLTPVNTNSPYIDDGKNVILPDIYQGLPKVTACNRRIYTPHDCVKKIGQQNVRRGDILTLMREPTNVYDHAAIAVYHDSKKLGYMYQNGTRDMVREYMGAGKEYLLVFDSFVKEKDTEAANVYIALYGQKSKKRTKSK